MSFNDNLRNECIKKNNRLCIGLDVDNNDLKNTSLSFMKDYIKDIIDSTIDLCPVYKINFAFYEKHGSKGFKILEDLAKFIDQRAITIADAKRGDIGNSSKYYAEAIFNHFNFDSVTVAPYMGIDSIEPFVSFNSSKGVFILTLTSNSGSENFQKKSIDKKELYKHVIKMSNDLNTNGNVGIVIGATNTEYLNDIKLLSENLPWLMPGVGFQGGNLEESIHIGEQSFLPLINVSRGILNAGNKSVEDIRNSAEYYTQKIRNIL